MKAQWTTKLAPGEASRKRIKQEHPRALDLLRSPLLAATILLAVYSYVMILLPAGGYYLGDQGVKYSQVDALVRRHSLAVGTVDDVLSVFRPTFSSFYVRIDDSYYSVFSPVNALASAPFYLAFGLRGLVIPAALGSLLAAFGGGIISRLIGVRYPSVVVLLIGLASPLLFYAFVLSEHPVSVGLAVVAVLWVMKKRPIAAGICVAVGVWFRPEMMILVPALVAGILLSEGWRSGMRASVRLIAGFSLGIAPWWVFNYATFGFPLGPQVELNGIAVRPMISNITLPLLPMGPRKWSLLFALTLALAIALHVRGRSKWPALCMLLLGVVAINLANLPWYMQGTAPSVIDVFPFVLVSLTTLAGGANSRHTRFLWIVMGSFFFGVTLLAPTWGGGGWGQRMLLLVFPLLAVLGWYGVERCQRHLVRGACIALVISSLVIQLSGLRALSVLQRQWTHLQGELSSFEPRIVATAVWWLPQVAASTSQHLQWYGIYNADDVDQLVSRHHCFWWVWSAEPQTVSWESPLHDRRDLPREDLFVKDVKQLSTRSLEAVNYCVR